MRPKAVLALSLKLALAIGLFWVILRRIDFEQSVASLESIPAYAWAAIFVMPLAQAFLLGLRWRMISAVFGHSMHWRFSFIATLISFFFSQGLPASIGGDAFRIWWQARAGVPVSAAAMTVLVDRLVGFVTLVVLTAVSLWFLAARTDNRQLVDSLGLVIVVVLAVTIVIIVVARFDLLPYWESRPDASPSFARTAYGWCRDCFSFVRGVSFVDAVTIMVLAFCVHLMTTLMVFFGASSMAGVSLTDAFAASTPALLLAYLPISIAGWGVREAVVVAGFAVIGVAAEVAFPVSVLVGLSVLAVSMLGGAYWVLGGIKRAYFRSHGAFKS